MANTPLNIPQLGNRFIDWRQPVLGDSYNWSWNRPLNQVQRLVIHHSVTAQTLNWQQEVSTVADLHVNGRRWGGVGYHFIIGSDGVVAYVGDIGTARANVGNHNEKVIGICLIGDFTKQLPTDIQINSAHDLCDFLLFHYPALTQTDNWDKVIGHKDAINVWGNTTATACPGSSWPIDMKSRIKDNIVYTPSNENGTPVNETPTENTTETPAETGGVENPSPETETGGGSDVAASEENNSTVLPDGSGSDDVGISDISGESSPVDNVGSDSNDSNQVPETNPQVPQKSSQYSIVALILGITLFIVGILIAIFG